MVAKIAERFGFSRWFDFSHQHSFGGKCLRVLAVWATMLIYICGMLYLVQSLLAAGNQDAIKLLFGKPFIGAQFISGFGLPFYGAGGSLSLLLSASGLVTFFFSCVLAPAWETWSFQVLPCNLGLAWENELRAACRVLKVEPPKVPVLLPLVVVSSMVFGILHGSILNILFQGVGGLFLSYLYLKCNNSYWATATCHAMWNFSIIFLLPILFAK